MSSTWGNKIKISLFGESHSSCVGGIIEGLPCGFKPTFEKAHALMERRRAKTAWDTPRKETDSYKIISGMTDGVLNGFPLTVLFENSGGERKKEKIARPSHCEFALTLKYGTACDISGGGHLSARLTLPLTFFGGLCEEFIEKDEVRLDSHILSIGSVFDTPFYKTDLSVQDMDGVRVVSDKTAKQMIALLEKCRADGDTVGGEVECIITGLKGGLGNPIFDGLDSMLAGLMFAIPAVKSFEMGDGSLTHSYGSEVNDGFDIVDGQIVTKTNHSGGVNGGITNGMPVLFRVGFRPIPSILKKQSYLNVDKGTISELSLVTRSDVCAAVRGTAVVEAAAAIAIASLLV